MKSSVKKAFSRGGEVVLLVSMHIKSFQLAIVAAATFLFSTHSLASAPTVSDLAENLTGGIGELSTVLASLFFFLGTFTALYGLFNVWKKSNGRAGGEEGGKIFWSFLTSILAFSIFGVIAVLSDLTFGGDQSGNLQGFGNDQGFGN